MVQARRSSSSPKMVIRGGMGVFYDRFGERATLLANRFNGVNQLDFQSLRSGECSISRRSRSMA